MQWLIDIIKDWVLGKNYITITDVQTYLQGMIVMWSGTLATIPDGWALCDGTQSTPDLRNRFIRATGGLNPPHNTGGSLFHHHDFTGDTHDHRMRPDSAIGAGAGFLSLTTAEAAVGTTDNETTLPQFYTLAYIMKL